MEWEAHVCDLGVAVDHDVGLLYHGVQQLKKPPAKAKAVKPDAVRRQSGHFGAVMQARLLIRSLSTVAQTGKRLPRQDIMRTPLWSLPANMSHNWFARTHNAAPQRRIT